MKNIIIIFLLIAAFIETHASERFEFIPINLNYKGVEAKGDTIVAYGDFGSALISYDDAKTWHQIRVFAQGNIINFFIEESQMSAFSDIGGMNISKDYGKTWNNVANINDSIVYVIRYPNGYFLQTTTELIKLSNEFEVVNEFPLKFQDLWNYEGEPAMLFRKSIVYFKEHLIAQNDSSVLIRFDDNLKPIDSLSFKELGLCTDCYSPYQLLADSNYIYISIVYDVFRTADFKSAEKIFKYSYNFNMFKDSSVSDIFKVIQNKKYSINRVYYNNKYGPFFNIYEVLNLDSAKKIGIIDCSELPESGGLSQNMKVFNDFVIENNRFTIVANNKFLASIKLNDNITNKISDLNDFNGYSGKIPDMVNDSSYLFYNYYSQIYKTMNNGITFEHVKGDSIFFPNNNYFNLKFKFYDKIEKLLYLGGYYTNDLSTAFVMISNDFGNSFSTKVMPNLTYNGGSIFISNLQKINDNFVIAYNAFGNNINNWILTYDKNFNFITMFRDSNYTISFINSKDTNSFLVISGNRDNTSDIKYSNNKGLKWDLIKKYQFFIDTIYDSTGKYLYSYITSDLCNYKEINYHGESLWIFFSFKKSDSVFTIEALDINTHIMNTIYQNKSKDGSNYQYALDCDSNSVYIALQDTLFTISNLFDNKTWLNNIFPNHGKIKNGIMKKYNNKLYALYSDDINPYNIYWIKPLGPDTSTSVIEIRTEGMPYLYVYPPFPMPASSMVRALLYWDTDINIDDDEICIYNIFGEKVGCRDKITIDKLASYKGYLSWDCSNAPCGIYLIQIKHGTLSKTLKIIVNR
jgi:hypothetical protein